MENIIYIIDYARNLAELTGQILLISLGVMGVTAVIGATAMGCKLVYQFFTME